MKSTKVTSYKLPLIILSCLLAITIGVLIAIWIPYSTGQRSEEKYESTGFAMGTYMQQTLFGGTESDRTDTAVNATKAVSDLQSHISWRETDSDIQNLNNHAGEQRVSIHEDTASVLNISLEVARRTNGAYDPTILPLSLLWNFDEGANKVPEKAAIKEHLQYVGYSALQVDSKGNTAFLSEKNSAVDLGAIGKGAACDAAVSVYRQSNLTGGIVAVGGSVGVYGKKADGSKWNIGVRNPNSENTSASMGTLSIEEGFVSTSGTYERTFTENGVMYHHILNPKTGYPADTDLVSVTIYCNNGALSDALSTACTVLGVEQSKALLASYDADAIFITKENKVIVTDGLKDCFEITASGFTLQS